MFLPRNLLTVRKNPTATTLPMAFEGYASCPLFVGKKKLLLAEFKYDGVVDETFFKDQEKPRFLFYLMKRFFFPLAYWFMVPRGWWAGRKGIRWS
jgi:eukaryotic sulfide quinone oxidoreductase